MITTRFYLDKRAVKHGEPAPLKLCIMKHGKAAYIPVGVKLTESQWDAKGQKISEAPNKAILQNFLDNKKIELDNLILSLSAKGELNLMNPVQIKNKIMELLSPEENTSNRFIARFKSFAESRHAQRTKEIYRTTYKRLLEYDHKAGELSFDQIRKEWLIGFQDFLMMQGLHKNSINIHLRNIRAVIRDAIDNEVTTNYPIRKIDIRPEETKKRSLTIDKLRLLFNMEVEPWQRRYIDYFKLSFFLIGVNPADLLSCKKDAIIDGRLVYKRAKTGKMYSIKIEPEAYEIMNRYAGNIHLVSFSENCKSYKSFVGKTDKGLKTIGETELIPNPLWKNGSKRHKYIRRYNPMFPDLSIYWCRHTWATIAFSIGIPDETIAAALGHSHGNKTTAIYIDKRTAHIDEANRRVIDYVLYDKA